MRYLTPEERWRRLSWCGF